MLARGSISPNDLGFGLDWGTVVQQDLDDPHMTVPGSTMQGRELVLREREREREREGDGGGKREKEGERWNEGEGKKHT